MPGPIVPKPIANAAAIRRRPVSDMSPPRIVI
jgi:hypothetical protein